VGVRQLYEQTLAERGFHSDPAQQRAVAALERCETEWADYKARRANAIAKLIKIHLANYFGGALLLPYGDFYREVTRTRYDVELLSDLFEMSYEAVAHLFASGAVRGSPIGVRAMPMHSKIRTWSVARSISATSTRGFRPAHSE